MNPDYEDHDFEEFDRSLERALNVLKTLEDVHIDTVAEFQALPTGVQEFLVSLTGIESVVFYMTHTIPAENMSMAVIEMTRQNMEQVLLNAQKTGIQYSLSADVRMHIIAEYLTGAFANVIKEMNDA